MRSALDKPHVQRYLREQRQVFRASLVDRATFRLVELSEQDSNLAAAVSATRTLIAEPEQEAASRTAQQSSPGLVVVIQGDAQVSAAPVPLVEVDEDRT
jgi:hypothetical protein